MATDKERGRVAKMRQHRRQLGFRETTIWIHQDVKARIDELISSGRFESQAAALNHAIEQVFGSTEKRSVS